MRRNWMPVKYPKDHHMKGNVVVFSSRLHKETEWAKDAVCHITFLAKELSEI